MKKAIIYVHGKNGSADEAEYYKPLCPGYDVFGVDYSGYSPWTVPNEIEVFYREIKENYDEVSLIANSIGAFFSMLALQNADIKNAYLISPIVNMERLILDMMGWAGVSEAELRERKEIPTDFGETLSWSYLCFVRDNPISWCVPTSVLYADGDFMTSRQTVADFAAAHKASLTVMEKGEHWFHTEQQLAFLNDWLRHELFR